MSEEQKLPYPEFESMDLFALAAVMAQVKERLEEAKTVKTGLQKKFDHLRLIMIPNAMDEEDITNVTFEGIGRVTLTSDVYASIVNKVDAFKWLQENNHGGLIQPTVNASSLKAMIKDGLKKAEIFPEDLFKVTPFSRASITKVKGGG